MLCMSACAPSLVSRMVALVRLSPLSSLLVLASLFWILPLPSLSCPAVPSKAQPCPLQSPTLSCPALSCLTPLPPTCGSNVSMKMHQFTSELDSCVRCFIKFKEHPYCNFLATTTTTRMNHLQHFPVLTTSSLFLLPFLHCTHQADQSNEAGLYQLGTRNLPLGYYCCSIINYDYRIYNHN